PVLVRSAHHDFWGGGGRLAATAPRSSSALPVSATAVAAEEDARVPDAGHEPNEARGPPESEPLRLIPPAPTRSLLSFPRASFSSPTSLDFAPVRLAREADAGACVSRAAGEPDGGPGGRTDPTSFVPALPLGRADARRMESATAFPSRLSAGGVS